jgi:hypothetical protein
MVRLGNVFSFYVEQVSAFLERANLVTPEFRTILEHPSKKLFDFDFIETHDPLSVVERRLRDTT